MSKSNKNYIGKFRLDNSSQVAHPDLPVPNFRVPPIEAAPQSTHVKYIQWISQFAQSAVGERNLAFLQMLLGPQHYLIRENHRNKALNIFWDWVIPYQKFILYQTFDAQIRSHNNDSEIVKHISRELRIDSKHKDQINAVLKTALLSAAPGMNQDSSVEAIAQALSITVSGACESVMKMLSAEDRKFLDVMYNMRVQKDPCLMHVAQAVELLKTTTQKLKQAEEKFEENVERWVNDNPRRAEQLDQDFSLLAMASPVDLKISFDPNENTITPKNSALRKRFLKVIEATNGNLPIPQNKFPPAIICLVMEYDWRFVHDSSVSKRIAYFIIASGIGNISFSDSTFQAFFAPIFDKAVDQYSQARRTADTQSMKNCEMMIAELQKRGNFEFKSHQVVDCTLLKIAFEALPRPKTYWAAKWHQRIIQYCEKLPQNGFILKFLSAEVLPCLRKICLAAETANDTPLFQILFKQKRKMEIVNAAKSSLFYDGLGLFEETIDVLEVELKRVRNRELFFVDGEIGSSPPSLFVTTEVQTHVATIQDSKASSVADIKMATPETVRDAILQRDFKYVAAVLAAEFDSNAVVALPSIDLTSNLMQPRLPLIFFAVHTRDLNMVKLLVEGGAAIKPNNTLALWRKFSEVQQIQGMPETIAEADQLNLISSVAITQAVRLNHTEIACYLLEIGAVANGQVDGKPFLVIAVINDNPELAVSLILHGASEDEAILFFQQNENFSATSPKINEYIQLFQMNCQEDLDIALKRAINKKQSGIAQYLLAKGANANGEFGYIYREPFLARALMNNDERLVKALIFHGASTSKVLDYFLYIGLAPNILQNYVRILMDYNIGINEDFLAYIFLSRIDVSGINFIGLSNKNRIITRRILVAEGILGAEKAIVTTQDLYHLKDVKRGAILKARIKRRLLWIFKRQQLFKKENKQVTQAQVNSFFKYHKTFSMVEVESLHSIQVRFKDSLKAFQLQNDKIALFFNKFKNEFPKIIYEAYKLVYKDIFDDYADNYRRIKQEEVNAIYLKVYNAVVQKQKEAAQNDKPLLILIGEDHYSSEALLYEILILAVAHRFGLEDIWLEYSDDFATAISDVRDSSNMLFVQILARFSGKQVHFLESKHRSSIVAAASDHRMLLRDIFMIDRLISHRPRNKKSAGIFGLGIIGAGHLKSLVENYQDHFEVLAFNVADTHTLRPYIKKVDGFDRFLSEERMQYAYDNSKVMVLPMMGKTYAFANTELLPFLHEAERNFKPDSLDTKFQQTHSLLKPEDTQAIEKMFHYDGIILRTFDEMEQEVVEKILDDFNHQQCQIFKHGKSYYCYGSPDGNTWTVTLLPNLFAVYASYFPPVGSGLFYEYTLAKEICDWIGKLNAHLPFRTNETDSKQVAATAASAASSSAVSTSTATTALTGLHGTFQRRDISEKKADHKESSTTHSRTDEPGMCH